VEVRGGRCYRDEGLYVVGLIVILFKMLGSCMIHRGYKILIFLTLNFIRATGYRCQVLGE
jgi:hypothetical protein